MTHLTIQDKMERFSCSRSSTKSRQLSPSKTEKYKIHKLHKEFHTIKDTIREGSFAKVMIVHRDEQATLVRYAAKFLHRGEGEAEEVYEHRALTEFDIARDLHHPNIVEIVSLCKHKSRLAFVMEYCEHSDLLDLMDRNSLRCVDKKCLFKQMLRGVAYMHSYGIAHHDTKPENMVLADDSVPKIIDFCLSQVFADLLPPKDNTGKIELGPVRTFAPRIRGTQAYLPPEILGGSDHYDARALDVWSCGVTAFILFAESPPWDEASAEDKRYLAFQKGWQYILKKYPELPVTGDIFPYVRFVNALPEKELVTVLLRMLHPLPDKRMTIFEALEDPWVRAIECCSPEFNLLSTTRGAKAGDCVILKRHDHRPPKDKLARSD
ncbi:kinase-like domain-containing protein [Aspergillus bertholletiae]|uniref:Kinase-like domain-containing protein n=1 Tax=Aspergillus bertholletiae TaxID=1226010 RepID=A0A5N7AQG1_9EURO|nr:kinase-like domain-containing protein [Aspergillus bertholletiae]